MDYGPEQTCTFPERTCAACGGTCFAVPYVEEQVREAGFIPKLRIKDRTVFVTDNGSHILDLTGGVEMDYPMAAVRLKSMTGVLETGLFGDICEKS